MQSGLREDFFSISLGKGWRGGDKVSRGLNKKIIIQLVFFSSYNAKYTFMRKTLIIFIGLCKKIRTFHIFGKNQYFNKAISSYLFLKIRTYQYYQDLVDTRCDPWCEFGRS